LQILIHMQETRRILCSKAIVLRTRQNGRL
jgi:hypothetical protein